MLIDEPLFPGTSTLNQLDMIMGVTNKPTNLNNIPTAMLSMFENLHPSKIRDFNAVFGGIENDAKDLIKNLIQFQPEDRFTVEQALEHPYVQDFHDINEEIICPYTVRIPLDDNKKFSIKNYREKIYKDIYRKKKEIRRRHLINRGYYKD